MDNNKRPNIENRGISMGPRGKIKAKKIEITVNPLPAGTELAATTKSSFRFNIPTPTTHFKGRTEILAAVRDFFSNLPVQTDDCWERIVAIVGLGGMGKTETAYKFAAEFNETFPNVAWINAENKESALKSFLGLAKYLKLVPNDQKEADLDLVRQVYRHIDEEDYGCTLFIFDNAIRLNPGEEEFGIYEYLPTDGLKNKRFPNVLITTQTQDWERGIKTIQVDELSAEESLEFFRSAFRIQSAECDDLFKELYELLEGYPLAMNLVASQIDYNRNNGSVNQLRQQIQKYIGQLNEQKLLNEKFNRAWPTKYHKTLSNVWKLTFEGIQQEDNGPDALKILQYMSFLHVPINSRDVLDFLACSSDCPLPAKKERSVQMKELFRVLERFYTARILSVREATNNGIFWCELGIHRLVQLVVRQQMDYKEDLERILFYFARNCKNFDDDLSHVNESALEEALQRSQLQLTQRALPYLGILACKGYPSACEIVKKTEPGTNSAASTIWELYYLKRGRTTLSENAIQVLHELVGLTESEERRQDRCLFFDITINLLTIPDFLSHWRDCRIEAPGFFNLYYLDGVERLVMDLILNVHSVQDLSCNCDSSYCKERNRGLLLMTVMLTKTFIREDAPSSMLSTDVIASTWIASIDRLRHNRDIFWERMYNLFHDANVSQTRIAMLRTCLWDRGLAKKLIKILELVSCEWAHSKAYCYLFLVSCMDICMDGVDLKDKRVQEVISSFCQMIAKIEWADLPNADSDYTENRAHLAVHLCSIWIKLFLMDGDPPSNVLRQFRSSLNIQDWVQTSLEHYLSSFRLAVGWIPDKYPTKYFPKFIQTFSSSNIKEIQMLLHVCTMIN